MDDQRDRRVGAIFRVIAIASAAVVIVTAAALFVPSVRGWLSGVPTGPAYAVGERVDVADEVYSGSTRTVIIFGRASCPVCRRVAPVLAAIVDRARSVPETGIWLLTPDPGAPGEREFAESLGLRPDETARFETTTVRLRKVPSLLIVDRTGRIELSLTGDDLAGLTAAGSLDLLGSLLK